jgi:RNA polymerase sigma-70 factor (ECF subfamily)
MEWLKRLERGDVSALAELYDAHSKPLYHYALSLLQSRSDAEDVLHNVMIRLLDLALRKELKIENLKTYLFRSIRHEALALARRRRTGEDKAKSIVPPTSNGLHPLDAARIHEALAELTSEQRDVVLLKIFGGLTFNEIAELIEEKLDTVASRYKYAVKKLEEMLHVS